VRQQNDGTGRNMYCVAAWAPSPAALDPKPEDGAVDVPIATFGDTSSSEPPDNGVASYAVKLTGGTYRIIGRVIAPTGNDDSFWVRFQGAMTNTANHSSGWVRWGLNLGDTWHEVPVRSMDDADQTVLFAVEAGGVQSGDRVPGRRCSAGRLEDHQTASIGQMTIAILSKGWYV